MNFQLNLKKGDEKMKKLLTLMMVSAVMIATSSQAATCIFTGGAGPSDPSWFTAANWDNAIVPSATSNIWSDMSVGYGPTIDAAGAVGNEMTVGLYGHDGDVIVGASGTLTLGTYIMLGLTAADFGTVLNNGTINVPSTYLHAGTALLVNNGTLSGTALILGQAPGGDNTLTNNGQITMTGSTYMNHVTNTLVNNGTLVTDGLLNGHVASSVSRIVNTGTITVDGWFYTSVNSTAPAILDMNGGVMVNGHMEMTGDAASTINLNEGIITNTTLGLDGNATNKTIVVDNGVMYSGGDQTAGLDYLISIGLITGKGAKTPLSSYDGSYTKLYAIPEPAIIGALSLLGIALLRRK